ELLRQTLGKRVGGELRHDLVAGFERLEMGRERRLESVEVEARRPQELGELAHLAERLRDQVPGLGRARTQVAELGGELLLEEPEGGGNGGQRLPEIVGGL